MTLPFLLAAGFAIATGVRANPTGPIVIHGQATFLSSGALLQITNGPGAIIHWNRFSISAGEITRFVQQSSSSAVLNRVVGAGGLIDPSAILGTLQSNGRVFLVNPSGILFGATAQVDVAGLVATSLDLSNADFLAGRLRFSQVPGAGSVINQGSIATASGGAVYLVGPAVTNNGVITSPQGEVILAAGNSVELVNPGTPGLRVEISAPDNEAVNLGQIVARSGRIGIYAGLIRNSGTLNADRAVGGPDGKIELKATRSIVMDGGGSVSAADGVIVLEAGESITLSDLPVNGSGVTIDLPGTICSTGTPGCGHPGTPSVVVVDDGSSPGGSITITPPDTPPGQGNGAGNPPGGDPNGPPVTTPGIPATGPFAGFPDVSLVTGTVRLSSQQIVNSMVAPSGTVKSIGPPGEVFSTYPEVPGLLTIENLRQ